MELTKEQIEFLDKFCKDKWILNSDGKVDVMKSLFINRVELTEIPVKFGKVTGDFDLYNNNLKDYFKSIKEEDFHNWDKLNHLQFIDDYPFMINIIKKYTSKYILTIILNRTPLTKLYYRD
jgi:hypothetical protein